MVARSWFVVLVELHARERWYEQLSIALLLRVDCNISNSKICDSLLLLRTYCKSSNFFTQEEEEARRERATTTHTNTKPEKSRSLKGSSLLDPAHGRAESNTATRPRLSTRAYMARSVGDRRLSISSRKTSGYSWSRWLIGDDSGPPCGRRTDTTEASPILVPTTALRDALWSFASSAQRMTSNKLQLA